jgi:hypothetical protein
LSIVSPKYWTSRGQILSAMHSTMAASKTASGSAGVHQLRVVFIPEEIGT